MRVIKKLSATLLAMCICAVFSLSANAAPTETSTVTSSAQTSEASTQETSAQKISTDVSNGSNAERSNSAENVNYDFSQNTIGNAVLTANENILTDDSKYQFIAATTRDGNVFYIIIDKLKTTDNVYFLNQVDTYDLQALLNNDNEDGEPVKVNSDTVKSKDDTEKAVEASTQETASDDSYDMNYSLILLGGIVVLGAIAFVIIKIKKGGGLGKKNNNQVILDDDFEDDEINEDKE